MKPLVYFCRWQGASLRLRGRDDMAVWGQLIYSSQSGEESAQQFHFDLHASRLTLQQENGPLSIILDEMGVPVEDPKT